VSATGTGSTTGLSTAGLILASNSSLVKPFSFHSFSSALALAAFSASSAFSKSLASLALSSASARKAASKSFCSLAYPHGLPDARGVMAPPTLQAIPDPSKRMNLTEQLEAMRKLKASAATAPQLKP